MISLSPEKPDDFGCGVLFPGAVVVPELCG